MCIRDSGITVGSAHDVIIRNLKIRIGDVFEDNQLNQSDPLSIGASKNVIIDHCTLQWAIDMSFRITGEYITMSNTMMGKSLYTNSPHEKGGHSYVCLLYTSFYDDNTNAAGRSFRTYLDSAAHPYDETTGQATESVSYTHLSTNGTFDDWASLSSNSVVKNAQIGDIYRVGEDSDGFKTFKDEYRLYPADEGYIEVGSGRVSNWSSADFCVIYGSVYASDSSEGMAVSYTHLDVYKRQA